MEYTKEQIKAAYVRLHNKQERERNKMESFEVKVNDRVSIKMLRKYSKWKKIDGYETVAGHATVTYYENLCPVEGEALVEYLVNDNATNEKHRFKEADDAYNYFCKLYQRYRYSNANTTAKVIPYYNFDYDEEKKQWEFYKAATDKLLEKDEIKAAINNGSLSRNEARSDLGLEPLEQADEVA